MESKQINADAQQSQQEKEEQSALPLPLIIMTAQYLKTYEQSKLNQANSFMYSCMQSFYKLAYKEIIVQEQKSLLASNQKSEEQNGENWMHKFASIKSRKVFGISSQIKFNPHQSELVKDIIAKEMKFKEGEKIVRIIGEGKMSAFLNNQGQLTITVQAEHEENQNQNNESDSFTPLDEVVQVSVGGQDLGFINSEGKVKLVMHVSFQQFVIKEVNLPTKANLISVAYTHTFVRTIDNKIYCWINEIAEGVEIVPIELSLPQGLKEDIIDLKSSNNQTLILTKDKLVYKIDHQPNKQLPFKLEQIKKLNNIIAIASSFSHCLALERIDIPPIREWDHIQVGQWIEEIGLSECLNIIKYKKISGSVIESANEEYLFETLGIDEIGKQQKFRYEVSNKKEGSVAKQCIYGWGSNAFGQLASIATNFPSPVTINLPPLDSKDFIVDIQCGKRCSSFVTNNGEVWICGNYKIEKPKKEESDDEENENELIGIAYGVKPKNKNKKTSTNKEFTIEYNYKEGADEGKLKRKKNNTMKLANQIKQEREENKSKNDKERNLPHRWLNITHAFTQSAFGHQYKVKQLNLGSIHFTAICQYNFNKPKQRVNNYKIGMTFKGADKIIKRLAFEQTLDNSKKYTVCYEDRFLGILEADVMQYLESEIPYHRIQMFKCNGDIVWDRKKKFTTL